MSPHKKKMIARRERQLARQTGFTAIENKRVSGAYGAAFLAFIQMGHSQQEASRQAWREVAKSLPARRMVRDYSARPSKSHNAAYRKAFVRDLRA